MKDNISHYLNITRDYTHFNYGTTLTKKDIDYYFGICEKNGRSTAILFATGELALFTILNCYSKNTNKELNLISTDLSFIFYLRKSV